MPIKHLDVPLLKSHIDFLGKRIHYLKKFDWAQEEVKKFKKEVTLLMALRQEARGKNHLDLQVDEKSKHEVINYGDGPIMWADLIKIYKKPMGPSRRFMMEESKEERPKKKFGGRMGLEEAVAA